MTATRKKKAKRSSGTKAIKSPPAKKRSAQAKGGSKARAAGGKTVKAAARKTGQTARSAAGRAKTGEQAADTPKMPLAVQKRRKLLTAILLKKRNQVVQGLEAQMGKKLLFDAASQRVDSAMDSADQSAQDVEQGIDFSLIEMKYEQFKDIADAFRKLQNDTYGVCEECGEEIDIKRLEVNPLARYCFACKSRKESIEKVEREETRFKE